MIKRHEDEVWSRLDQLYTTGTTFIRTEELYHWYSIKRISKLPWRDLKNRWEQMIEEKDEELSDPRIAEIEGGYALFFAKKPGFLSKMAE